MSARTSEAKVRWLSHLCAYAVDGEVIIGVRVCSVALLLSLHGRWQLRHSRLCWCGSPWSDSLPRYARSWWRRISNAGTPLPPETAVLELLRRAAEELPPPLSVPPTLRVDRMEEAEVFVPEVHIR
eukprot:COSAG01_NODE_6391_length_3697_cov_6.264314_1_plen_125_part_10